MNKKVSYVEFERKILINLVNKYKEIIENKKTDSSTVFKKQQTWLQITNEYNRHQNVQKRLTKQLKRLWENTKAKAKKTNSITINYKQFDNSIPSASDTDDLMDASQGNPPVDGFDRIFDQSDSPSILPNVKQTNRKSLDELSNESLPDEDYERFLTPIISAKVKKVEEATTQQKELHNLSVQREQLQIRLLKEEINRQAELHSFKMEKERELYDLRINQEKDLHSKRIRNEEQIHQLKLAEYNKVQAPSYPIIYK